MELNIVQDLLKGVTGVEVCIERLHTVTRDIGELKDGLKELGNLVLAHREQSRDAVDGLRSQIATLQTHFASLERDQVNLVSQCKTTAQLAAQQGVSAIEGRVGRVEGKLGL